MIDAGWSPAEAARAVRDAEDGDVHSAVAEPSAGTDAQADFLAAAARLDSAGVSDSLDRASSTGSFEHVVENWLSPTLGALGEEWASGRVDVAGEHLASEAVLRRLSAAFEAAGRRTRGPALLVGLPPGGEHELGALAFAVVARRCGLDVHYLGSNVPTASWVTAVDVRRVDAVVLAVVMAEDRGPAAEVVDALREARPDLLIAAGGAHGDDLASGVVTLPASVRAAVDEVDELLHQSSA